MGEVTVIIHMFSNLRSGYRSNIGIVLDLIPEAGIIVLLLPKLRAEPMQFLREFYFDVGELYSRINSQQPTLFCMLDHFVISSRRTCDLVNNGAFR